jgi:hypothetical protein
MECVEMTDTERDAWEVAKISRVLADAPAAELRSETPWLQEAKANIERALARAQETRRAA